MTNLTRREFLELGSRLAVLMGLGASAASQVAEAVEQLAQGNVPLLWLQAQGCTGCSVSLLNSEFPGVAQLITQTLSLKFHSNVSAAAGEQAVEVIRSCTEQGGHLLAVEGSIPVGMPEACILAGKPIADHIVAAARTAKAVVAVGTCSSFGGIPAAENNPTAATDVGSLLQAHGVSTPLIRLPGCPCHPDWLVGTIVHVLRFGLPSLDDKQRPTMFYGRLIHDQCPRFADYEREKFAKTFSDEGCLFRLGCMGTQTKADCTMRLWNSGTNSCIHSGSICIGCAWEGFTSQAALPLYRKNESQVEHVAQSKGH